MTIILCKILICNAPVAHAAIDQLTLNNAEGLSLYLTGNNAARKNIWSFYERDIKEIMAPYSVDYTIQEYLYIATYDLNNDGVAEIFVHFISPISCGMNGCSFAVYQKHEDGRWKNIYGMTLKPDLRLLIARHRTNGYSDIFIADSNKDNKPIGVIHWDKKKYCYTSYNQ